MSGSLKRDRRVSTASGISRETSATGKEKIYRATREAPDADGRVTASAVLLTSHPSDLA
jgi:hypothetical protein